MRHHKPTGNIDTPGILAAKAAHVDSGLKLDLQHALRILSPKERLCITLQLIEGQRIDKIVAITGMAEGTVKSHLSRGKQKLTVYLKQNGYD